MNNIQKRFALFLLGCIGTRSLLVYFAKNSSVDTLKLLGYVAFIISFGFIFIYLTDARKSGPEVCGETIWWNNLRPIHALLYFLFAYNAINKNTDAWLFLLIDVILGLTSFLYYHYSSGNFSKLLQN